MPKPAHGDLQSFANSNHYEANRILHDLTLGLNQGLFPWTAKGFRLQNIWLSQICEVWFRSYLVGTGTSVSAPSMTACCSLTKATKGASRKSTSPTSTLEASASLGNFFINLFFSCTDRHGGNLTNPANAEKKDYPKSWTKSVLCCSTCQSKTLMVVDVFQGMATSSHLSKWGCCSASAFS